jgi:hypothetical protein
MTTMVVKETMGTFNVQLSAFGVRLRRSTAAGAGRSQKIGDSFGSLVQGIGNTRGYKTWAPNVELRMPNVEL